VRRSRNQCPNHPFGPKENAITEISTAFGTSPDQVLRSSRESDTTKGVPDSGGSSHLHSGPGAGLRILYIGALPPDSGGGGTAIVGFQLLTGLAGFGHKVRALSPATEHVLAAGDPFARAHPELSISRFPVKAFPVPYFDAGNPSAAESRRIEGEGIRRGFHAALAEVRPQVVIVGRGLFVWHVADLARAEGIPFIVLIQDSSIIAGIVKAYPALVREKLLAQFRQARGIVAVANHLGVAMQGLGLGGVKVVPNSVDHRKFAPRPKDPALLGQLGIGLNQAVVLHASNLRPAKRPLDLVESAERVLRHRAEVAYVIVGDGPYRPAMEEECRRRGLERQFRFVGWVDHDRMPDFINLADAVVMPSEREGLALVYLETQACGTLLIASDIPAAREVIQDGETGLFFRKGDIADLTEKTLLALRDGLLRAAVGQRARQSILTRTLDGFIDAYEQLVRGVAHRGS
jgi:glycosyltransferase involved in cell wall biosynthesis